MATRIGIIGDGNVGHALEEKIRLAVGFTTSGDDTSAKKTVLGLARGIGFDAVDAGPLQNARLLEPLAFLNIQLGYVLGMGTEIGFKLLHR